ncbi:MAG: lysophospholipid acyltransferase family protein [Lentisphaerae bacterium]|nr:lysophospholipid acyltransferase family protein [Lentisphaerota bacterium]
MAAVVPPSDGAPVPVGTRLLLALSRAVSRMDLDRALALGGGIGWIMGTVVRHRRSESAAAIRRSLTGLGERKIAGVLRGMYAHLGRSMMESFWLSPEAVEAYVRDRVTVHGQAIVDAELAKGRGALMLTAHTGGWDLMGRLARPLGFPLTVIAKAIRSPSFETFARIVRDRFGMKVLSAHGSFRDCLRTLRRNEVLAFMFDQNMTRADGIFVDFFGRPACTTPGLAYLASRSGASVIPIFDESLPDGRHAVRVLAPLPPPPDLDPGSIHAATQAYTKVVEDWIRAHPEQWIWIHRRWKTQPVEGAADRAGSDGSPASP